MPENIKLSPTEAKAKVAWLRTAVLDTFYHHFYDRVYRRHTHR